MVFRSCINFRITWSKSLLLIMFFLLIIRYVCVYVYIFMYITQYPYLMNYLDNVERLLQVRILKYYWVLWNILFAIRVSPAMASWHAPPPTSSSTINLTICHVPSPLSPPTTNLSTFPAHSPPSPPFTILTQVPGEVTDYKTFYMWYLQHHVDWFFEA